VVLQSGFSTSKTGTVTLFGRLQSGLPFTPIVQGDPNGDGRGGDRAFVPNSSTESDPVTRAQLLSLLSDGSGTARACVQAYAGQVAARNGCRGPWTQSLNLQWRPPLPKHVRERLTTSVYMQNVLGGIDQAVHGANDLKGWGSS